VQGLNHFAELQDAIYRSGRYGRCLFGMPVDEPPSAIHIVGRWHWLEDSKSSNTLRNPLAVRTPDGRVQEHIALAPQPEGPLSGALMLIDLSPGGPLSESGDHLVLFAGGFEGPSATRRRVKFLDDEIPSRQR